MDEIDAMIDSVAKDFFPHANLHLLPWQRHYIRRMIYTDLTLCDGMGVGSGRTTARKVATAIILEKDKRRG